MHGTHETFSVYKLTVMARKVVFTKTNEKDTNINLLG